jgi:hypothetical protein
MRKYFLLITLIVVLIVIAVFLYWARKNHTFLYKADEGNPTLNLNPAIKSVNVGDNFNINLLLNTENTSVSGVQIASLHYDPAVLSVIDADESSPGIQIARGDITNFESIITNTVNDNTGVINYKVATANNYYSGNGTLAIIDFKALVTTINTPIIFDFVVGDTTQTAVFNETGNNILSSVGNANYTINSIITPPTNPAPTPVSQDSGSQESTSTVTKKTTKATTPTPVQTKLVAVSAGTATNILPVNLLPSALAQNSNIEVNKNDTMKTPVLLLLYIGIPLIITISAIFIYLKKQRI